MSIRGFTKMNSDNFEQRLQHQSPRQIPTGWREEILSGANSAAHPSPIATRPARFPSSIFHLLSSILWPHPRAWAGLAAIWIFIFGVNFATRDSSPPIARKISPLTPEMRMVLKEREKILTELIEPREPLVAERRKLFPPRPRSELRNELAMT